jgi:hypothetical protein
MHRTDTGEKRKALKREASELEREVKVLEKVKLMGPAAKVRQEEADRLKAEAEDLKGAARLEDLHLWQMEKSKKSKTGIQTYHYWIASWREGKKVRHVYLGSCRKVDHETALQKARKLKAEALGVRKCTA